MGLREPVQDGRTITLGPGAVWRNRPVGPALLRVDSGRVWLTAEGTSHDMLFGPGDRLLMVGGGLVVIQAMGAAPAVLSLE